MNIEELKLTPQQERKILLDLGRKYREEFREIIYAEVAKQDNQDKDDNPGDDQDDPNPNIMQEYLNEKFGK